MELQYLIARLPVDGAPGIDPARVVDVFHRWVAQQSMPEMLVDVAELLHVPKGPGVVAVGHEADYALDNTGGRWGVLYRRKAPLAGSNAERLAHAIGSAAHAAQLLETEFGGALRVSRTQLELIVNDRILAPNDPATWSAAKPELRALFADWLGHGEFEFTPLHADARARFGVAVKSARPFAFAALAPA